MAAIVIVLCIGSCCVSSLAASGGYVAGVIPMTEPHFIKNVYMNELVNALENGTCEEKKTAFRKTREAADKYTDAYGDGYYTLDAGRVLISDKSVDERHGDVLKKVAAAERECRINGRGSG